VVSSNIKDEPEAEALVTSGVAAKDPWLAVCDGNAIIAAIVQLSRTSVVEKDKVENGELCPKAYMLRMIDRNAVEALATVLNAAASIRIQ
jgi:hypothetical protein